MPQYELEYQVPFERRGHDIRLEHRLIGLQSYYLIFSARCDADALRKVDERKIKALSTVHIIHGQEQKAIPIRLIKIVKEWE